MNSERNIIGKIKRLNEGEEVQPIIEYYPQTMLEVSIRKVMSSYQNANKWLDTIKETMLMDFNCVFYSEVVHQLAHTMPGRFDKFGEILHTNNIRIPYPFTDELTNLPSSVEDSISMIFSILDQIRDSLLEFKSICDKDPVTLPMSIAADQLVVDITNEYSYYTRIEGMLPSYGRNIAQWDKKIYEYWKEKENLI